MPRLLRQYNITHVTLFTDSEEESGEDSDNSEGIPETEEKTTPAIPDAPTPVQYAKACCVCLSNSRLVNVIGSDLAACCRKSH